MSPTSSPACVLISTRLTPRVSAAKAGNANSRKANDSARGMRLTTQTWIAPRRLYWDNIGTMKDRCTLHGVLAHRSGLCKPVLKLVKFGGDYCGVPSSGIHTLRNHMRQTSPVVEVQPSRSRHCSSRGHVGDFNPSSEPFDMNPPPRKVNHFRCVAAILSGQIGSALNSSPIL